MSLVQITIPTVRPAPDGGWRERLALLRVELEGLGSVVVAYSGGVDSSLLLRVAVEVLGERALGVIGRSDSYAARELELALEQATSFGARIEVVTTGELADPNFRSNPVNRCYHCKTELYRELAEVRARTGARVVLDGTIADDLADWRPGRRAATEQGVRSLLAELGFTKTDVRAAAASLGLASHDKPASPCLASRIPYGTEITRENLAQVERSEAVLRGLGFRELRVRHHGDVARIEVAADELGRFADPVLRKRALDGIRAAGFRFVAMDLAGFSSGSLHSAMVSDDASRAGTPSGRRKDPAPSGTIHAFSGGEAPGALPRDRQESGNRFPGGGDISPAPHGGGGTENDLR